MGLNEIYSKFLRKLGIKFEEQSKLLWSFLMVFLAGGLQCYFSSLPMALFLTHYSSATLPKVYLAVAGLSVVLGIGYTFFEYRLTFNRLMVGLTLIVSIVWTVLGAALFSINSKLIILVLLIWAILAYDLLGLAVWSVLNRIFSLQQAKNSFGIIKGCQSLGGALAGLASPLLIYWVGLRHLIIWLGLFTFTLIVMMLVLLRANDPENSSISDRELVDENNKALKITSLLHNNYVLKLFGLIALGVFSTYIIALIFNTVAEAQYTSAAALAGFLGIFFGLVDGVDLFCSLFLYHWLLKRFGLVATLFVLPVLGILITVPILIFNTIPVLVPLVFWLIVSLKLSEDGIRASLTHMGNLLLLQPFPPRIRSFLHSKSDVIVVGLATAVVSLFLIVIVRFSGLSIGLLSTFALLCFMLSVAILCTLKRNYIEALIKAISNRYFGRGGLLSLTKEDLQLLVHCLASPHPDEVIYALSIIERIEPQELYKVLGMTLQSKDLTVRIYTLEKIKNYKLVGYFKAVIALLDSECPNELKAKALDTAAHLDYTQSEEYLRFFLHNEYLPLNRIALNRLFKDSKTAVSKALAEEELSVLIASKDEKKRVLGAQLVGDLAHKNMKELLSQLTRDDNELVRQAAFEAVMKAGCHELYNDLIKNLQCVGIGNNAYYDFFRGNALILEVMRKNFNSYSHEVKAKALFIASQIHNKPAQGFIETFILNKEASLKHVALRALSHFEQSTDPQVLKSISQEILLEAKHLQEQLQYLSHTPSLELTALLRGALKRKIQISAERLLLALSLYYDKDIINKAINGLAKTREDEKSYALELIDTVLETLHKKIISPLLSELYLADLEIKTDLHSLEFHHVLQNNIMPPDQEHISLLTSMACIYVLSIGELSICHTELKELQQSRSPLIRETVQWAQHGTFFKA